MLSDQLALALFFVMILLLYGAEVYLRQNLRWYWGIIGMIVLGAVFYFIERMPSTSVAGPRRIHRDQPNMTTPPTNTGYSYEY